MIKIYDDEVTMYNVIIRNIQQTAVISKTTKKNIKFIYRYTNSLIIYYESKFLFLVQLKQYNILYSAVHVNEI